MRNIVGWIAVTISTGLAALWAFWGSIENFHEGWYFREWWRNVGLALIQYLPWMFIPMLAALAAMWRPWVGVAAHLALAIGALFLFGLRMSAGSALIATPMVVLAALYGYGRPHSLRWARRIVIGVPIITAIVSGAFPGWRAMTRPEAAELSSLRVAANGVNVEWAPAGPGWPDRGVEWSVASDRCARLNASGLELADIPQHLWRLPTVNEAVRSMTYRGRNAGGVWNADTKTAHFEVMPDKEPPLWNQYSQVIYWWTADESDATHAYRVVYNGYVNRMLKTIGPDYLGYRCVRTVR